MIRSFVELDEFSDLVLGDPAALADRFNAHLAASGVKADDVTTVLCCLVSAIASVDPELAVRLEHQEVRRQLADLDFALKALLGEILAVRKALEPSNGRTDRLLVLVRESVEASVQSFVALGVEPTVARRLAESPDVGADVVAGNGEVRLMTAAAGSGKTLTALRSHQVSLVEAAMDERAPIPVFVNARFVADRELREAVQARAAALGVAEEVGARIVIDCLDEVDRHEAQRLLSEAAAIVGSWPATSVVAFGRPDVPFHGVAPVPLTLPSKEALNELAESITGTTNPFWGFSPALRRAVELPLYAIAAAVLVARRHTVPHSRTAIIEALIYRTLRESAVSDEAPLRDLARALTDHGHVNVSTIGTAQASELSCSRLVLNDGVALRFAVPIFQEWFAAKALLDGAPPPALDDAQTFARWRHAYALAITIASESDADRLMQTLFDLAPFGARLILDEALWPRQWEMPVSKPPENAASRVNNALHFSFEAFSGPLAAAGPLAVGRKTSEVSIENFRASIELRNGDGRALKQVGSTLNWSQAAWPWEIAADVVMGELQTVLDRCLLLVEDDVVQRETTWALARIFTDDRGLDHKPIDPALVLGSFKQLQDIGDDEIVRVPSRRRALWLRGADARRAVEIVETAINNGVALTRPWPGPDNLSTRARWVSDLYKPLTAAGVIRDYRQAAIRIYEAIVAGWMPTARKLLPTAATLPAWNRCTLMPRQDGWPGAWMSSAWFPLAPFESSFVSMELGETPEWRRMEPAEIHARWEECGRGRPPFSVAYGSSEGVVQGLFSDRPATTTAFRWLAEDLRTLRWSNGTRGYDD